MKEQPIIFSTKMVRAILNGQKTQTRRVVRPQPTGSVRVSPFVPSGLEDGHGKEIRCPYTIGDHLWVRESIGIHVRPSDGIEGVCIYRADLPDGPDVTFEPHWTPSIHMPRWASRITLDITAVHLEHLQKISDSDAKAEGVQKNWIGDDCPPEYADEWMNYTPNDKEGFPCLSAKESYRTLWDAINGEREGCNWESDPWVWVVEYKIVQVKPSKYFRK